MEHRNFSCNNFRCCARTDCWLRIRGPELPCTSRSLFIIGQPVPQLEGPTTSSNLAFRYTRPTEIIQEDINLKQLLLSDTTTQCSPLHLRQLLRLYKIDVLSPAHILFLLVYLIALECGFVPKQLFKKFCRVLPTIPPFLTYHSKNVLFLSREKPMYQFKSPHETYFSIELRVLNRNVKHSSLYSTLTALVSGNYLLVTLTPTTTTLRGSSSCLSINRYIISHLTSHEPISRYFRNLDQLTAQLRDKVFIPVRNEQLAYMGASPYPSISGLPSDIREILYEYLNENDLKNLSQMSKQFYAELEKRNMESYKEDIQNGPNEQTDLEESALEKDNSKNIFV
ncbi:PREDICTED: protein nutcracker-like [Bactrocera latifrons]|uniref:F-box domain-containing protein n=1 Tax=Bactrocera latifrons TaxID=174628 RepID=A0A0K8UG47_BACLA|nr:PREDICTED: protein nutcracker-like [Bactrocera latifrons]